MHRREDTEVLVVGAGPVGMFTALWLAESGIRVKIIDQESRTAAHSYACALHPRTLELLDQVGLAEEVEELGHRIDTIAFYEDRVRRAELKLAELPVKYPCVVVLPQSALESLLEQRLRLTRRVEVDWNCRLSGLKMNGNAIVATIDKLTETATGYVVPEWAGVVQKTLHTRADFVVGADGHNSQVRACLGIEYEQVGNPELFVVYEFELDGKLDHEMSIVLGDHTTNVMWPFSHHKCRWSFQIFPADAPGNFPVKDRRAFSIGEAPGENDSRHHLQRLLQQRAPWFEGNIQEIDWATDIQFEHRLANEFGRERCWLVGDAAHQTGPVGMQSVNLGLREGADLAAKVKRILREKVSPELLQTYNRDHRADWQHLLGLKGAPKPTIKASPWIKEHGATIPECLPASGEELTSLLGQLGLEFE
ncbi:MAG: FAD-dependent monooxygenase [Verrucomicrobia bacterium]|nr:FAD-dependent monooxygenase [Verrucomicrobiota bacterium]